MKTLNWDNPLVAAIPPLTSNKIGVNLNSNEVEERLTEELETIRPINPDDKRVVNGSTDVNQLAPFKYPWAWDFFLNANKNHC